MDRKDALTDLVEFVQGKPPAPPPSGGRQVVNPQGEVITLGHPDGKKASPDNKGVPLELDVREYGRKVADRVIQKLLQLIGKDKLEKPIKIKGKEL